MLPRRSFVYLYTGGSVFYRLVQILNSQKLAIVVVLEWPSSVRVRLARMVRWPAAKPDGDHRDPVLGIAEGELFDRCRMNGRGR